jgi:hypothetical protein
MSSAAKLAKLKLWSLANKMKWQAKQLKAKADALQRKIKSK